MQVRYLGVAASVAWLAIAGWLASRQETWITAWKLYCRLSADPNCTGTTVYLVVRWPLIAGLMFIPLAVAWLLALTVMAVRQRR